MYPTMLDRFIKYAKVNTRSDITSDTIPSTPGQKAFLLDLVDELKQLGFQDVHYDDRDAYVVARLASTCPEANLPAIGFIAHVDTADYPAEGIDPQVHTNYQGTDVVLNEALGLKMTVAEFPNLKHYVGQTLITTDGTTLLGADDKAGLTSMIEACLALMEDQETPRGDVWLAFGPDEEIGLGAHRFEPDKFPVEFAYTLDSGVVGKLEYETFNAATATVKFTGTSVHPGQAKDVMVNALWEATRFAQSLPAEERPETTTGDQGFYMLSNFAGSLDQVECTYIIRDHDAERFQARKDHFQALVDQQNETYDYPRIQCEMYDQYYNMKPIIDQDPRSLEIAVAAYQALGIEPDIQPFRGGTDGCIISYKGIPTPNLFTGAENLHGCYEFVTLEAMSLAADVVREIIYRVGRGEANQN